MIWKVEFAGSTVILESNKKIGQQAEMKTSVSWLDIASLGH